jgi:hypothetical protein
MTRARCPLCATVVDVPEPLMLFACGCGKTLRVNRAAPGHAATVADAVQLDYYAILRVTRDASSEQLKAAYRQRSKEAHPDVGGDADEFNAVTIAYEVLGDPERRRVYDEDSAGPPRRGPVTVPDVTVANMRDAATRLRAAGLTPIVHVIAVPHGHPLRGKVVGQYPYPASLLEERSPVLIIACVSLGSVLLDRAKQAGTKLTDVVGGAVHGFVNANRIQSAPRQLGEGATQRRVSAAAAGERAGQALKSAGFTLSLWLFRFAIAVAALLTLIALLVNPVLGVIVGLFWALMIRHGTRKRKERLAAGKWW